MTDTRNLGAIARSAELLGADAIIVSAKHSARDRWWIHQDISRCLKVAVCRESSLFIGYWPAPNHTRSKWLQADSKSGEPIYQIDFNQPCVLIMGSEDEGVHPALLAKMWLSIQGYTQVGTIDSFNVSVAAEYRSRNLSSTQR